MTSEVQRPIAYEAAMRDGSTLHRAGRAEFALLQFEDALAALPDDANALAACGTVMSELERHRAAYRLLSARRESLANDADGLTNLGIAAEQCNDLDDAAACYEQAMNLAPLHPRALVKLCWLHARTGDFDGAIELAQHLSSANPGDAGRTLLLVDVLLSASRFDEACAALAALPPAEAVSEAARPHLIARVVLANALAGHLDIARGAVALSLQTLHQVVAAIALIPGLPQAIGQLAKQLDAARSGDIDSLLILCASQSISAGHWRGEAALTSYLREIVANAASDYSLKLGWRELRKMAMMLALSAEEQARLAGLSAEHAEARALPQKPLARHWHPDIGSSHIRLGIGIDSVDDPHHVARISRLLRLHDRKRFRLNLYCVNERPARSMYEPFESLVDQVIEIAHLSAGEATGRIRLDRLDLMIDMTGHKASVLDAALWARIAKVQAGLPAWSDNLRGTPYDLVLEDTATQATFASSDVAIDKGALRQELGLPPDAFVMTSLPAPFMLDQTSFASWLDILERAHNALLILPFYSTAIHEQWLRAAAERGIESSRIVFLKELARAHDMSAIALADLYLDTLRINASEGLADALMAGVPSICISGDSRYSQLSAKVLIGEGLPEFVFANRESYVDMAVKLASDAESLTAFKEAVHRTMSGPRAIRSMTRMIEWENALIAAANLPASI